MRIEVVRFVQHVSEIWSSIRYETIPSTTDWGCSTTQMTVGQTHMVADSWHNPGNIRVQVMHDGIGIFRSNSRLATLLNSILKASDFHWGNVVVCLIQNLLDVIPYDTFEFFLDCRTVSVTVDLE